MLCRLSGDKTAALTGVSVGLRVDWEHPQRRKIFNVTGLTSGDLFKNPFDPKNWPESIIRKPDEVTRFGNISQTFNLFIPYKD